jgi:hypothetical protein
VLDQLITNWSSLVLIVLGVGYLILLQYLSKREARPRELTEAELLAKMARMGPYSEYEIFHNASYEWHIQKSRIDHDFKTYLLEGTIPYYVNSFLRKEARERGNMFRPPFILGGGSLPWLK